jgi:hypothetical protein
MITGNFANGKMMLMQILLAMNLLLALGLLLWILMLRKKLSSLEAAAAALAAGLGVPTGGAVRELAERKGMFISIEILNQIELARKESWVGGAFGSVAPALLNRIVYARTLKMMQQELERYHVKAEVRLHGA